MTFRTTTLILFALFLSVEIQAQSTGGNQQNTLLPEINPQDIEIRSEFRARFPGLRRQPILGFNPKPRVFRIDPNRMPFMESRDEAVASVAISQLERPAAPPRDYLPTPDRTNVFVKAGFGSFVTPEVEAYAFQRLGSDKAVSGNLNFRSSEGHLEDPSGFRYLDADVRYTSKLTEKRTFSVEGGILSDFNRMFRLGTSQQNLIGEIARKDYTGAGARINFEHKDNELEGWEATLGGNVFGMDLNAGGTVWTGELNEQVFDAAFSKHWAGNRLYETFHINASFEGGNYEYSEADASQWIDARGSVEYRKMLDFSLHLTAKAGVAFVSDAFSNNIYITPEATARYNLRDRMIITGRLYGKPEIMTAQDHHENNRFLNFSTDLVQSYTSGLHGEIAFQLFEGNRIFGGMSYELTKNYPFYVRQEEPVLITGVYTFYDVNYERANVFEFFGGITQQLVPNKFWFDARFYARRPKLNSGGDIPFEERLGVNGSLSYKPAKAFKITGWTEYVGSRTSPSSADDLGAFLLLNAGAEYQITNRFGVYAKVLNILGQKYEIWEGYEERPLQAFGGITIKL